MPLAQGDVPLVSEAMREFSFRTTGRVLADFQEGYVKTVLLEVLLDAGCTVYEASTIASQFWSIRRQSGVFTADANQQFAPTPGYRPDARVRLAEGNLIRLELKCRPAFGSKAQANYGYVRTDLTALSNDQCDVLILVADERGYDLMNGRAEFATLCPPRAAIGDMGGVSQHAGLSWNGRGYAALATRMPSGYETRERVIVAWYQG
jgi:hypothetical protein